MKQQPREEIKKFVNTKPETVILILVHSGLIQEENSMEKSIATNLIFGPESADSFFSMTFFPTLLLIVVNYFLQFFIF